MKKIKAWASVSDGELDEHENRPMIWVGKFAHEAARFHAFQGSDVVPVTIILPTLPKRKKNTKTV